MTRARSSRWVRAALLAAALAAGPVSAEELRVGVAGSRPFVVEEDGALTGAAVEVWRAAARELGLEYTLVSLPSVDALIEATATGSVAVGVGPITITAARAERVEFTQPYFEAQLAMLRPEGARAPWAHLRVFLTRAFLAAVGSLLLVLFLAGNLFWLVERRQNAAQFPPTYRRGVLEGMWFAIVTMTTVGYGDRVPVTRAGRTLAGAWMIFSMVAASSITAGIATALTLSGLQTDDLDAGDLSGMRIAALRGTVASRIAERLNARLTEAASLDAAVAAVEAGRADGVLFDGPALRVWLVDHPDSSLVLSEVPLASQPYGFALPPRSPLRARIDRALISLWERQRIQAEIEVWLPER